MPLSAELIPQRKTRCLDRTGSTYAPAAQAQGKRTLSHDALLTSSAPESVLIRKVWRAEMFAFEFDQTLFEFEHARPHLAPLFELPPHIHSLFPYMPTSWRVRIFFSLSKSDRLRGGGFYFVDVAAAMSNYTDQDVNK